MRLTFFAIPLIAATAAFGQTAPARQFPIPAIAEVNVLPSFGNCPVGMSAEQRGGGQTLWTIAQEDERSAQQGRASQDTVLGSGVHVELAGRRTAIRAVELAVFYVAPGSHLLLVGEGEPDKDLQKTFHLSAADGASFKLAGDLLVGRVAGITRVHVMSIQYADGRSWQAAANTVCSIEPNRVLRVAAR